jgi:hypothetical protein
MGSGYSHNTRQKAINAHRELSKPFRRQNDEGGWYIDFDSDADRLVSDYLWTS